MGHRCPARNDRVCHLLLAADSVIAITGIEVLVFLPLGSLGQCSFAIMQMGKVALNVFPKTHTFCRLVIVSDAMAHSNDDVGLWDCMAFLCYCSYQQVEISVQHWMVRIHVPIRRLCHLYSKQLSAKSCHRRSLTCLARCVLISSRFGRW